MDYLDAEELAIAILGLPDDSDIDDIEQALAEQYEISLDNFKKIAESLMPLTIPARAAISGELFHGFVKDGGFICKMKIDNENK